ncbi:MAG: primosomal protein N' [Candidatus Zixiibacteriota bacterium]
MSDKLVNLAIVGPHHNLFTYKIRDADTKNLKPGCRFLVPFGKTRAVGFFVEFQTKPVDYRLRFIKERIDAYSPFPKYLFDFCRWISEYYFAPPGETLAAALPGTGSKKTKLDFIPGNIEYLKTISAENTNEYGLARYLLRYGHIKEEKIAGDKEISLIVEQWLERNILTTRYRTRQARAKLLGYRLDKKNIIAPLENPKQLQKINSDIIYSRTQLLEEMGFSDYRVKKLVDDKFLRKIYDEGGVTQLTSCPIRHDLPGLSLLPEQKKALDEIVPAIAEKAFRPFMLFGVTGSGKTMVYCHAAKNAVESGGSVLVLVPEIALSGLLLSSFAAFFGDRVAVIHSGMTLNQRQAIRQKIHSGEIKVVIGPRSAIFAPLYDPRLIIIDEEHDPSYKQDDPAPRYHGRDAAVMLARMVGCPIILGSASPSVESYYNAITDRYKLLTLSQRPKSGYRMPKIVMLDMKTEKISGEFSFLSYRLKRETEKQFEAGGQIIYYLNRRGFSPQIKCRECGHVPVCENCGITLTYHRADNSLKCHFCDYVEPSDKNCARCNGHEFIHIGTGTQRVEENLAVLFSNIRTERIDSDRAASKSGQLILGDFGEEKFDLLLGTQMITKGLDFPGVTLVGVLSADIGLDMPDFRAAEKTYARLLQVAGRAGRGDREGLVMVQTYYNDHPVIRTLSEGNYVEFFERIVKERETLFYPPFSRLINITLQSPDEKLLEKESLGYRIQLEERLAKLNNFVLLGPAKAPLYKLRGNYRRRFILKCAGIRKVVSHLRNWQNEKSNFGLPAKIRIILDIDPVNMM